jgi:hypothetical protein
MGFIHLFFVVFFVCFIILGFRLAMLDKGSIIVILAFRLGWIATLGFIVYIILKNPPTEQISIGIGLLLGIEFSSLIFGRYGLLKQNVRMIRLLLIANIAFILFYNFYFINLEEAIPTLWLFIIQTFQLTVILCDFKIIGYLKQLNYHLFLIVHEKIYPVFNEMAVTSGFDDDNYFQFTIPLMGNVDIENNSFITMDNDDDSVYCLTVGSNTYEIRKDRPLIVEHSGDITLVTITVNQNPLANKNDNYKNILS